MKKYRWLASLVIALLTSYAVLRRELWFDEALTLLNFVLPLELGQIYFSYIIPNNQIVYSMLLKVWDLFYCGGVDIVVYWRLLSVVCALGMLAVLTALRQKIDGRRSFPTFIVLSSMCVSGIFMNYATALRGYALSWLLGAVALYGLYEIFHQNARRGWLLYAAAALLAVGTVPTNLLMLAAAAVYAIPWMEKKFWRDRRFYGVMAVIPAALIIFYAPIATAFLNTFKLGEGFSSRWGAIECVLGMYIVCFGLLLIFGLFTLHKQPWQYCLRWSIWLFPAAAILLLHRAPFPRVFVTLLPVLAMLVIDGTVQLTGRHWNNFHRGVFAITMICCQILLILGGYLAAEKLKLSCYEDDFFHPWYMLPNYRSSQTAERLVEFSRQGKIVFLSFPADPLPILFYALNQEQLAAGSIRSDVPCNSVKSLPPGAILILRSDEAPEIYEKRFGGILQKHSEHKQHSFYTLSTE